MNRTIFVKNEMEVDKEFKKKVTYFAEHVDRNTIWKF